MRSLTLENYKEILSLFNPDMEYNIFIETGTYKAATIKNIQSEFKEIYTVEYSIKIFNELDKSGFKEYVHFYNDNSESFLQKLLPGLKNKNIVIFLDAHWAGIETGFYQEDCPILKELKIIKENNENNYLIIMDDFNKFGVVKQKEHYKDNRHQEVFGRNGKVEDWADITLNNVLTLLDTKNYKIIKERLIIKIET